MKVLPKLLLRIAILSGGTSALCRLAKPIKVPHNSPLFKLKAKIKAFNYKCETRSISKASMMRKRRRKGWDITEMTDKSLN